MVADLPKAVMERKGELVQLRRDFHRYPELSFQEKRTSSIVADKLREVGLEVKTGVARTGVVGLLRGSHPGKTLLIRADMDALPLEEANDVPYKSQNKGVMHACGHDGHTAILLTTASILVQYKDAIKGNVKFVFQPAEEFGGGEGGALPMVQEGVLEEPKVDAAIGLHLWSLRPTGKIAVRDGGFMAGQGELRAVIKGRGGHGALPHQAVDPIVASAQFITALQTLVSREVPALKSAVVSICTIHGGTAFNIIPDEVVLKGTFRYYDEEVRDILIERIEGILKGITSALNTKYELRCRSDCPPVLNDKGMVKFIKKVASSVVGEGNVELGEPIMGADDVSEFLLRVPGCYFFLGAGSPERGFDHPHHSPDFDIDEEALPVGVEVFCRAALEYLS